MRRNAAISSTSGWVTSSPSLSSQFSSAISCATDNSTSSRVRSSATNSPGLPGFDNRDTVS
jgi:hypothetical protein